MTKNPALPNLPVAARRAIVLLSGGLDSLVTAAWAARYCDEALALTFDYGQRAAAAEMRAARAIAQRLGIEWRKIELPWLGELGASALTDRTRQVPDTDTEGAEEDRMRAVWVPNRNLVFIAIAGAFADALNYDAILLGLNRDEGTLFPDNTPQFAAACTAALGWSTLARPQVFGPLASLPKVEIVRLGVELGAPLELVWSCYHDGHGHCWQCDSCRRLREALETAGVWPERRPVWGDQCEL